MNNTTPGAVRTTWYGIFRCNDKIIIAKSLDAAILTYRRVFGGLGPPHAAIGVPASIELISRLKDVTFEPPESPPARTIYRIEEEPCPTNTSSPESTPGENGSTGTKTTPAGHTSGKTLSSPGTKSSPSPFAGGSPSGGPKS